MSGGCRKGLTVGIGRRLSWKVPTPAHLADLVQAASVPAAAPHHRRALLEVRLRREALDYATRITDAASARELPSMWDVLSLSIAHLGATLARLGEHRTEAETGCPVPRIAFNSADAAPNRRAA